LIYVYIFVARDIFFISLVTHEKTTI
jgi:hypothetical protein